MQIPKSTPQQSLEKTKEIISKAGVTDLVCIVGIRGYYKQTMGDPTKNDRKIYDDALFIVAPECFMSFNANVDPGYFRKKIASLKTGVWKYKLGIHGLSKPKKLQYEALVQAAKVTVMRDEVGEDTGMFGINIHRGGNNSVSSLGCQTIVPAQWDSFIATVKSQLKKHNQKVVPYILVEA